MKYITVNTEELLAALKPSQFRPFKDAILKKEFKQYLNHIFKDKDRIYIPFEQSNEVRAPRKIEDYLSDKGLEIVDYKAGIAKNKDGKLAKIGRALSKDKEGKKLLDLFNISRSGVNKKDLLMIVISRHPYDIAGMSTGRGRDEPGDSETGWGWSSCMNLRSGSNRHYVTKDVENGTLIAYIIDSEDKNINKPISRLLLKQYINIKDKNDTILYPDKNIYGENIKGFREKVIDWIKTLQEFKGTYFLDKNLYPDGYEDLDENEDERFFIGLGDKYDDDWNIRFLYYKNNIQDKDSKEDDNWNIQRLYYENNPKDKDSKAHELEKIRFIYYENNPKDKDAKKDEYWKIRLLYYENNSEDKDAKKDEDWKIRLLYYKNNSEDKDYENDKNEFVKLHNVNYPPL